MTNYTAGMKYEGVVKYAAREPEDRGYGPSTNVMVTLAKTSEDVRCYSSPGDTDYDYVRGLEKGAGLVVVYNERGEKKFWKVDLPIGYEPPTEEPVREDIDDSGEPVRKKAPVEHSAQPATWQPMRPVDKLQAHLMARDQAEMIITLVPVAREALERAGLANVSDDQVAAWTTSLWLGYANNWRKPPLNPREHGLRVPLTPRELSVALQKKVERYNQPDKPDKRLFTALQASMSRIFSSDDERHAVLKFLLGQESSKDLSAGECRALLDWIGADEEGGYRPSLETLIELAEVRKVL